MQWISSKDFLTERKFTKSQTWAHIENGRLIPYDRDGRRVFPTEELRRFYYRDLVSLRERQADLNDWLAHSNAETDLIDVEHQNRITSFSGVVIAHEEYAVKRARHEQTVAETNQQIREWEAETDRANAWKNHDLTPAQQEELFGKFFFSMDDVNGLSAATEKNEPEPVAEAQEQKPAKRLKKATSAFKIVHSSKHLSERRAFEGIYNTEKMKEPPPTDAVIIRKAKKDYPKGIGPISDSTIRKWIKNSDT